MVCKFDKDHELEWWAGERKKGEKQRGRARGRERVVERGERMHRGQENGVARNDIFYPFT